MSGIAGILTLDRSPVESEPAERMAARLAWRGGDDDGAYRSPDGRVALAARRLAATDAGPEAALPMANETHDVWMVLDGEILNHRALRHSLELVGHRFRSASDAEVALHAYEQWGLDFPHHLQGAYALALWDDRRDRLVLVRDRLGRKPLFVAQQGSRLAFASGIVPVLDELGLPRLIDPLGLASLLELGFVPPPRTIAAGVSKLAPGEMLVADRDTPPRRQAWGRPEPDERRALAVRGLSLDRHAGNVRTLLECSVADRLMGDGAVAVAVGSGGAGGAVAAIVSRLTGRPAQAVAVVDAALPDGEAARDIRLLAAHARADLTEVMVSADEAAAAVAPLAAALPEPLAAPDSLAAWFAARAVGDSGAQAMLTGDGADEVLLGHPAYGTARRSDLMQRLRRLTPARLARLLPRRGSAADEPPLPAALLPFDGEPWHGVLDGGATAPAAPPALSPAPPWPASPWPAPHWMDGDALEALGLRDLGWRVAEAVTLRADAAAQAHGIEARLPFLDDSFVAYGLAIPGLMRSPAGTPRLIFKRGLGDLVPAAIATRPQAPRALPRGDWMAGPLGARLADRARTAALARSGTIPAGGLGALLARHRAEGNRAAALWAVLVLLEWTEAHGFTGLAGTEAIRPPQLAHSAP